MKFVWIVSIQTKTGENKLCNILAADKATAETGAAKFLGVNPGTDGSEFTSVNRGIQVHTEA